MKKLPYGNCNFEDLVKRGFAYVDKTRYIELLENENNWYQYLLRPRRFGKSLFVSVLENYYDIRQKDKFAELFGNLYIGKNPTPEQGKYAVLRFDFSTMDMDSPELFRASFKMVVELGVRKFLKRYSRIFAAASDGDMAVCEPSPGIYGLLSAFEEAENAEIPIIVIIDEYDNFVNDLLSMGDTYRNEVMSDGIVRAFYKTLKAGTGSAVRRIFITGVSPMMVNDLTSGFNMAVNLSLRPYYNEIFGFTNNEIEWLMNETGVDKSLISVDMEYYYNGYRFNKDADEKVYNPQMVLFLFDQICQIGKQPEQIVDPNLKTSYRSLQRIAADEGNRDRIVGIIKDGGAASDVSQAFSLDELGRDEYFVSFMYYLGMLTFGGRRRGKTWLKVPNYSIRTLYWEYISQYIQNAAEKPLIDPRFEDAVYKMATEGDIVPFLDFFTENILKRLSNRDLQQFDEKYVKVAMLSALFFSNFYLPISEDENTEGYTDIYLQKSPTVEEVKHEYVIELKYLKIGTNENKERIKKEKEEKFAEAIAAIEKYKNDKRYAGNKNINYAAIVFRGKGEYDIRIDY